MNYLVTLAAALGGAFLFERLRVPAGALVGGMFGVIVVRLAAGYLADLPGGARFVVYALLGWVIGETVDRNVLETLRPVAVPMVIAICTLVLVGGVLALLLTHFGVVDSKTAFLAASPGGLTQMSALGSAVGADVPIVLAVHMLRIISVVIITPAIVKMLPLTP